MSARLFLGGAGLVLSMAGAGCGVLNPMPVWELTKGASQAASYWLSAPTAHDTVAHAAFRLHRVCIVVNQDVQAPEMVPALQAALWEHKVESRVVSAVTPSEACDAWLSYTASIEWAIPPFEDAFKYYLSAAYVALADQKGQMLASSRYTASGTFSSGKWHPTRRKIAPVVTALLTGVEQ
jgi:hypothetical protein